MDAIDGEMVVRDKVSRFGLREVHMMKMGGMVDMDRLSEQAMKDGGELLGMMEYEEEGLGIWHLWVWWRAAKCAAKPINERSAGAEVIT